MYAEYNIYWIKNFQLYESEYQPRTFYGGIFKKVGLPMKAMELRWKHQCEKSFWLVIHFSIAAPPSKRASAVKRKCPLWEREPAEPRGSRMVQLGISVVAMLRLGVSLVSPAVWCPGASTRSFSSKLRIAALPSLALPRHAGKLFY